MEKLTNEERANRKDTAGSYIKKRHDARDKALAKLPEELQLYLSTSYVKNGGIHSRLGKRFGEWLAGDSSRMPSGFVKQEMSKMFGEVIPEELRPSLLYEVDRCLCYPYTDGYYRRPFRSSDKTAYLDKIHTVIYSYVTHCLAIPFEKLASGEMSEEERAAFDEYPNDRNEFDIAYSIDQGGMNTIAYIEGLLSEGSPDVITYGVLRAVFMSGNSRLHQLCSKLLLAAKLQEGLRQAVCESCDYGTREGFAEILKTVSENDLIRYSSVVRALGTWTGIIALEAKDNARIARKTLELMNTCLSDEKYAESCLASEDAMQIYIALWTVSTRDAAACVETIRRLSREGTALQLRSAAYFSKELLNYPTRREIGKLLLLSHTDDPELMAINIPNLLITYDQKVSPEEPEASLPYFFKDRDEAEAAFSALEKLYAGIPGKALGFDPCVFPWNKEALTRSSIVADQMLIAAMLRDDEKTDMLCGRFSDLDGSTCSRGNEIHLLLENPRTETQRDTAVSLLADKIEYARGAAFMIVKKIQLEKKHYLMLEDMLRYKAADMRAYVLELIMQQSDDELAACAERLLSDKKEEKRTAGLDIIMQLSKDKERAALAERCRSLTELIKAPTTKEQILIDEIKRFAGTGSEQPAGFGLFTEDDSYVPVLDREFAKECCEVFAKVFPCSELISSESRSEPADHVAALKALDKLIGEHKNDEFRDTFGDIELVGSNTFFRTEYKDGTKGIPFPELWEGFFDDNKLTPELLVRMNVALPAPELLTDFSFELFGREFKTPPTLVYAGRIETIIAFLIEKHCPSELLSKLGYAVISVAADIAEKGERSLIVVKEKEGTGWSPRRYYVNEKGEFTQTDNKVSTLLQDPVAARVAEYFSPSMEGHFAAAFALNHYLSEKLGAFILSAHGQDVESSYCSTFAPPVPQLYIRAAYDGVISEGYMYKYLLEISGAQKNVFIVLCGIAKTYRDSERRKMTRRRWSNYRSSSAMKLLLDGLGGKINEETRPLVEYAVGVYEKITDTVLDSELRRGDSPAEFTSSILGLERIYGADRLVQILSALGRDTLERSTYLYGSDISKRKSLSHLLGACVPREDDTAQKLAELLKETDITEKRLVEAALFSPEWIDLIGELLGWEGFRSACFYFMAHMNEQFDDVRKAMIAKFTPIPTEDLAAGAFDINWFREASGTVGEKRFGAIYDAAKYISDGAKHSRARKYADAVLGKLDRTEAEKQVREKRNKDTLMAIALIPIKDEEDMVSRYLLFKQFAKEAKAFGQQRRASETAASDMAMRNLAENAGFTDVTRLTLRMETRLFDDIRPLLEPAVSGDLTLSLRISGQGRAEICCVKGGKELKAIPAKNKKDELVLRLGEVKKQLNDQYSRTRTMFEQSMEDRTEFRCSELEALTENPVVAPLVNSLVFTDGSSSGLLRGRALSLADGSEKKLRGDSLLRAAHPFDLYSQGCWHELQKLLFDKELVQPFKQVFRELYVKTEDEREAMTSLRYAGNQIQPKKPVACLRSRRWVADIEDGLQKVYYKENIIARIYALADWFSPADIEAPTLEWVDFFDRKTGKQMRISEIPDIIFSEVMRDVDLAVSVAHAGGVDPETSHSTIEMRRAVCEFTLPLFRLDNVTFEKSHAFIKGSRADYSIHLGSGAVHLQGGPMINILPVHSQHRGKLFLPFLDEDPKTAQIISEILLFAEDSKIKDPFILTQIK